MEEKDSRRTATETALAGIFFTLFFLFFKFNFKNNK